MICLLDKEAVARGRQWVSLLLYWGRKVTSITDARQQDHHHLFPLGLKSPTDRGSNRERGWKKYKSPWDTGPQCSRCSRVTWNTEQPTHSRLSWNMKLFVLATLLVAGIGKSLRVFSKWFQVPFIDLSMNIRSFHPWVPLPWGRKGVCLRHWSPSFRWNHGLCSRFLWICLQNDHSRPS